MDFTLTPEQEMFRGMFRDFAAKEVARVADQADKQEALPARLLQRAAGQGFMGAMVPEEPYGGAGLDAISYMLLLLQTLAGECASTALALHVHNSLALRTILAHGRPSLTATLVPEMVSGERLGAFALSEADAGSDPTRLRTRAKYAGQWVLNGIKSWVSNGGLAGVYVMFAMTDPSAGARGMSAFAVPADTPGVVVGGRQKTLGLHAASITRLYLEDCAIPEDHLLGEPGQGYKITLETLDFGRIGVAAIGVGGAQRALELGTRFAAEHVQFGGPIAQKQAIQAYLADAATNLAAAECLVRQAAWLVDEGKPFRKEAAMAKLFSSRVAADVTDQVVQIHGGYGFIVDYPAERYYRDARALELVEGTSQIQQVVIASELLEPYGIKVRP